MVYVLGVLSAFFYGLASVLQHREASAAPQAQSLRLGLLTALPQRLEIVLGDRHVAERRLGAALRDHVRGKAA